jgi:transcriptional regulator with XRE-family HTH domain
MSDTYIPRPVAYAIRHRVQPVKAYRLYAGISVEQLALEAKLTAKRLNTIEAGGVMNMKEATQLAEALGTSAEELAPGSKRYTDAQNDESPAAG